jgi:LmbE family N-acetylglucosaminyl deacetylase
MLPVTFGRRERGPLRILCLGSHSDDIEIGCGGTLLRLLSEHPESVVTWVVFSATPAREQEARASAADFLADAAEKNVIVKSFRESFFPYLGLEIKEFFEELKPARPDLVLCHHRHDFHQDHRTLAELVWNTFRDHIVAEYEIPKYEGDLGTPNMYVPLSRAVADRKVELLMKHFASQKQRSWFRPETFHGLMSIRGIECNAPEGKAEAFHVRKLVV